MNLKVSVCVKICSFMLRLDEKGKKLDTISNPLVCYVMKNMKNKYS